MSAEPPRAPGATPPAEPTPPRCEFRVALGTVSGDACGAPAEALIHCERDHPYWHRFAPPASASRGETPPRDAPSEELLQAWQSIAGWREENAKLRAALSASQRAREESRAKAEAYDRINTPEIDDFLSAVKNEALHQRERWGVDQDGGKADADWFWLVGYLAGKALHDVKGKRLHHIITTGAALLNWHAHAIGAYARMRPGIEPPTSEVTT